MPEGFASTPEPPYYAVIFTSQRTESDDGYEAMAQAMYELALKQPGCVGVESTRGEEGLGITVSYFVDEASIRACSRTPGIWWHSGSARSAGTRTTRSASPKWSGPTEDRRGGKGPEGSRESDETIYFPMCDANSQAGALSGRGDDHPSGGRARCRSVRRVLACLREAARTHRGSPRASCA